MDFVLEFTSVNDIRSLKRMSGEKRSRGNDKLINSFVFLIFMPSWHCQQLQIQKALQGNPLGNDDESIFGDLPEGCHLPNLFFDDNILYKILA